MSEQGAAGYSGQAGLTDDKSEFNKVAFLVAQMLGEVRTIVPVLVVAVAGGGILPPGTVDVHPLINQIDGVGNATPHGNVLNIPVWRMQGGGNTVICDPAVDDIGIALIADRDISKLKATGEEASPGSFRRFSLPDAIYLGGFLNAAPDQYIIFTATGIKLVDKNGNVIEMKSGSVTITGNIIHTGTFVSNGKNIGSTHTHTGVTTGGGVSGPPT